jgi:hypothetical protein
MDGFNRWSNSATSELFYPNRLEKEGTRYASKAGASQGDIQN